MFKKYDITIEKKKLGYHIGEIFKFDQSLLKKYQKV